MRGGKHSFPRTAGAGGASPSAASDQLVRSPFYSGCGELISTSVFFGKAIGAVLCLASLPLASAIGDSHFAGPLNEHFYELVEVQTGVTWHAAKAAAESRSHEGLPGYLATITTAEEHDFVTGAFPRIGPEYVWLGADDEESEGRFTWITGESARYSIGIASMYEAWDSGEPNGGIYENCLGFADNSTGWNDENCDRRLNFYLVEYSAPILATFYSQGKGLTEPVNDPEFVGYVPVFASLLDPDADFFEPALFDEDVQLLADVPKYLNATASTDPDFGAVISGMEDETQYTALGLSVVNPAGDEVGGASTLSPNRYWQSFIEGEFHADMVERIELLVGDQTYAYYDAETRTAYSAHQLTVNVYGATKQVIQIGIDFKPGNRRNVINPNSKGRLWVAVVSDGESDALQVDPATVALGAGEAAPDRYRVKDVNRDRLPDLMLRFRTPEVGIQCGDTELELTGETYAGDSIVGLDLVKTVGCKKPKKGKKK